MLDRKGKSLDLQEVWTAQEAIDMDAQRVCCQFGVQSGTQAPEGVSVIGLNVELVGQLIVDRLNDLSHSVDRALDSARQLTFLVSAWQRLEADAVVPPQLGCPFGADVAFVANHD